MEQKNKVEQFAEWAKNHKILSVFIIIFLILSAGLIFFNNFSKGVENYNNVWKKDKSNCVVEISKTKKEFSKIINEIKLSTPSEISTRGLTKNRESIGSIILSVEENDCLSVNNINSELNDLIDLYSKIIEDNVILWESEAEITTTENLTSHSKELVEKIKTACKTLEVICNFYSCSDKLNLVIKNSQIQINNY